MNKQPVSRNGFIKISERLRALKEVERPAVLEAVQRARDLGDLSENADYKTAREQQRYVDYEIRRLEAAVASADIIDTDSLSGDTVMFGATVLVEDEDGNRTNYRILSEIESDLSLGIIANTSPLARGLIGKRAGGSCVIRTPSGEKSYDIVDVKYGRD
jgi:transcription elongation factor GreA